MVGSLNSGAGFPISGEGTWEGSRSDCSPNEKTATSATNTAIGIRNFICSGGRQIGGLIGGPVRRRIARTVASVADGNQPAQRHDQRAQPDESNHRFVLNPHAPAAVSQWFPHCDKQVPRPADVDTRFGHRTGLDPVDALFRPQFGYLAFASTDREQATDSLVVWASTTLSPGAMRWSISILKDDVTVIPITVMPMPR